MSDAKKNKVGDCPPSAFALWAKLPKSWKIKLYRVIVSKNKSKLLVWLNYVSILTKTSDTLKQIKTVTKNNVINLTAFCILLRICAYSNVQNYLKFAKQDWTNLFKILRLTVEWKLKKFLMFVL